MLTTSLDEPFQLQLQSRPSTKTSSRRTSPLHRSLRRRRLVALTDCPLLKSEWSNGRCAVPDCPVHTRQPPSRQNQLAWISALNELPKDSPQSSDFADLSQLETCSARTAGPVRTRKISLRDTPFDPSDAFPLVRRDITNPPRTPAPTRIDFRDPLVSFRNLMPVLTCDSGYDAPARLSPRIIT